MPQCQTIRRKHRKVCIGDLDSKIKVQVRALTAPTSGVDSSQTFTDTAEVWAMIETARAGETWFDDVGEEFDVTHNFYIIYRADVSAETWLEFDGQRFDILAVENLDERKEFLKLRSTNRGLTSKGASSA